MNMVKKKSVKRISTKSCNNDDVDGIGTKIVNYN